MIRKTLVLAALATLAPVALLAAAPAATTTSPATGAPHRGGDMFNRLDTNHDGAISKDEAAAGSYLVKSFDTIDTNHDGLITQDEMRAAGEKRREEMKAEAEARFKAADKNGDHLLSKEEVTAGMPRLARNFDQLDTNKDGQLSPEELAAARHHMAGGRGKGYGGFGPGQPTDNSAAPSTQTR
jgi:hypothetical protein